MNVIQIHTETNLTYFTLNQKIVFESLQPDNVNGASAFLADQPKLHSAGSGAQVGEWT